MRVYQEEFLQNLITQATSVKSRYKPVSHEKVKVGDIILLKEENSKVTNFPLAIVEQTTVNYLDEVTDVVARKGNNREIVKRHVNSIIPLLSVNEPHSNAASSTDNPIVEDQKQRSSTRPRRAAAIRGVNLTKELLSQP